MTLNAFSTTGVGMQIPMILMTCHGTIVCSDGADGLVHVAIDTLGEFETPVVVDLHALTREGRHERMLTKTASALTLEHVSGLPDGCSMILAGDRRTAGLQRGGSFYSAEPSRRDLAVDRSTAGLWESFLFVTEQDFLTIRHLFRNRWVIGSSRRVVAEREIVFREGFILQIGDLPIDLRYNLPLLGHNSDSATPVGETASYTVLVDGWKIERIYRYKPLIYFTAFGSPYALEQAYTAIGSLLEFGGYDGHIHVISDLPLNVFADNLPAVAADRLSVQPLASHDWVGFVAAKYEILEHPAAFGFQPLLFLDTDIVCDAPLEPLLATIVALDRMSAPLEDVSFLQTNPSVGASLIQRAGLEARFSSGLNGGSVGIPNLRSCAELMHMTRTIITNHNEIFGRDQFRWVDQEVLNYVSFCVGHFDTAALLRFIRYGWKDAEFDASRRLGLVHFWPAVIDRPKLDRMRDYMATLRAASLTQNAVPAQAEDAVP